MAGDKTLSSEDFDSDVVAIGGGGAGLAAAIAASENGASVLVLEKRRKPGGSSAIALGLFAAESRIQKSMLIDATKETLFKKAMDYSHWRVDPWILRTFLEKSADTITWLENMGIVFESLRALYPNQTPLTWHCIKGNGAAMIKSFTQNCKGLGVKLLCSAAAKKLVTNRKGCVTGVVAKVGKNEIRINTKAVIIATGGFGGSKKLMRKYYPTYHNNLHLLGIPHTGDGITMAIAAGAATEGLGTLQLHGHYFPSSAYVNAVAKEPNTIWVNKNGLRYTDETTTFSFPESGNAVDRQPDKLSYSIFDEAIKRTIMEKGLIRGILHVPHLMPQVKVGKLEEEIQKEARKGNIKISYSWQEIARWIGAEPEVLKDTIANYNISCTNGYDETFYKEHRFLQAITTLPFYAVKCYSSFLGTIGGIRINQRMEVLNSQSEIIPGLFAAGTDTGGWEADTYNPVLAGSTLGFAINSGRIAGEHAAKYVRK
jgi:fumarate reductase flavoprotein subunit